jgi:hypothetical protein
MVGTVQIPLSGRQLAHVHPYIHAIVTDGAFSLSRMIRVTEAAQVIYKTEHDGCRRFPEPASDNLKSGVSLQERPGTPKFRSNSRLFSSQRHIWWSAGNQNSYQFFRIGPTFGSWFGQSLGRILPRTPQARQHRRNSTSRQGTKNGDSPKSHAC